MSELDILYSKKEGEGERDGFVIEEEIKESYTNKDCEEKFDKICNLCQISIEGIDVYDSIHQKTAKPGPNTVLNILLLSEKLGDIIDNKGVTKINIKKMNVLYERGLKDIAISKNIEYSSERRKSSQIDIRAVKSLLLCIAVVIEQLVGYLINCLRSFEAKEIAVLPGHKEDLAPILDIFEEKSISYTILHKNSCTIEFIKSKMPGYGKNNYSGESLFNFAKYRQVIKSIKFIYKSTYDLWFGKKLKRKIVESIHSEEKIRLEKTIDLFLKQSIHNNLYKIACVFTIANAQHLLSVDKLITGGLDSLGLAVSQLYTKKNLRIFHIPHGTITQCYPNIYPGVQFVSNYEEKKYLKETTNRFEKSKILPYGRPYFRTISRHRNGTGNKEKNKYSESVILLATRPFPDNIRRSFVKNIISCLRGVENIRVIIKTHPDEDSKIYYNLNQNTEVSLSIKEGNLNKFVQLSNLVVTVNSNVGLESAIMGTPYIIYNPWNPLIRNIPPYEIISDYIFEELHNLRAFLTSINFENTTSIFRDQLSVVKDMYIGSAESSRKIANACLFTK